MIVLAILMAQAKMNTKYPPQVVVLITGRKMPPQEDVLMFKI